MSKQELESRKAANAWMSINPPPAANASQEVWEDWSHRFAAVPQYELPAAERRRAGLEVAGNRYF